MLTWKVVIFIRLASLLSSSAFVCFSNSTLFNEQIDFEELTTLQWYVAAKIDSNLEPSRPFDFPLHQRMTVKVFVSKSVQNRIVSRPFKMEFHCGESLSLVQITRIDEGVNNKRDMIYSFCSIENTQNWQSMFLHYSQRQKILLFYVCNQAIEYLVVLTAFTPLSESSKQEITKFTEIVLRRYSSNLMTFQELKFVDAGENSEDCREIRSKCKNIYQTPSANQDAKGVDIEIIKLSWALGGLMLFFVAVALYYFVKRQLKAGDNSTG